jgi:putative ABC transport system permease protein
VQRWDRPGESSKPLEVVGYVADTVYRNQRDGLPPTMYVPLPQVTSVPSGLVISVRAESGSPALLTRQLAAGIGRAAPAASVTFLPLREQVRNSLLQERLLATLSACFGALGLLLAGLGLYGVTSYMVARRRTEMGIRMALGAAPQQVVQLVLTRVFWLVVVGVACGTAVAIAAARLLGSLLYGIQPGDPATLAGSILLLAAIGLIAGLVPAWRAARIDPARVLRDG